MKNKLIKTSLDLQKLIIEFTVFIQLGQLQDVVTSQSWATTEF